MVIAVKVFGVLVAGAGVVFLLNPKAMKPCYDFVGKNHYVAAVLNILFSIVFLLSASQCKLPGVIIVMGILGLIKGIAIPVLGPEKLKAIVGWWLEKPIGFLRLIGIFVLAMAVLILYSA